MLTTLSINNVRNLTSLSVDVGPQFNIWVGPNGSGKTSILEAIHILNTGRSFRTRLVNRVIRHDDDQLRVFGKLMHNDQEMALGVERQRSGDTRIRLNQETMKSHVEITRMMPLLVICPDSHRLLSAGPKYRRQFIDWGMFHVEQLFYTHWQRAQRAIKQRNAALKQHAKPVDIALWDRELISAAEILNEMRQRYLEALKPVFVNINPKLLPDYEINLYYQPGWNLEEGLANVLEASLQRDYQQGYTQYGPHRADLWIRYHKTPVQDVLSQGQQKLTIYALRLAQGQLLKTLTDKSCLFLIDDLPAELDMNKRSLVADALLELESQVFITGAEESELRDLIGVSSSKLFHVEHVLVPSS